jgi:hypothetical protein
MSSITYDELEQNADRAFAYALLAHATKAFVESCYRTWRIANTLDGLIADLTQPTLDKLAVDTSESAVRVKGRLQELHNLLARACSSEAGTAMGRIPVLCLYWERVQERTEDLGDILDGISLRMNAEFKDLVTRLESELVTSELGDSVAGMHR